MSQNTSHAVMSQRVEEKDSLDDFPTPRWATRALLEHILQPDEYASRTVLEPACGLGYMAEVLKEYFRSVSASDVYCYGYGEVRDFLSGSSPVNTFDWVITNPPFKSAEAFVTRGLQVARVGVAVLVRTVFIESVGRYNRLFKDTPCSVFAQFTERVPIVKGRVDPRATTATGYAWLIWRKSYDGKPEVAWIPPSRKALEQAGDYEKPSASSVSRASPCSVESQTLIGQTDFFG